VGEVVVIITPSNVEANQNNNQNFSCHIGGRHTFGGNRHARERDHFVPE
jgi:hypothetical protein